MVILRNGARLFIVSIMVFVVIIAPTYGKPEKEIVIIANKNVSQDILTKSEIKNIFICFHVGQNY